jgi:HEAT repeat protein
MVEAGELMGRIDAGMSIAEVRQRVESQIEELILNLAESPPAVNELIDALTDEDPYVRKKVAYALGVTKNPLAVDPLIATLRDGHLAVQREAIRALGKYVMDPRAVQPLIDVIKGEVERGDDQGERTARGLREEAMEALGTMKDPRAVEPLIEIAKVNSGLQAPALDALGSIRDARAVEPLIAVAEDRDSMYRVRAVRALGEISDPRAVEPLISLLPVAESSQWIAEQAALSLGKIGDTRAVEPLIAALRDSGSPILGQVAWALNKITGKNFLFGNQSHKKWMRWWERNRETILKERY